MSIAANKHIGIRAALVQDIFSAQTLQDNITIAIYSVWGAYS